MGEFIEITGIKINLQTSIVFTLNQQYIKKYQIWNNIRNINKVYKLPGLTRKM